MNYYSHHIGDFNNATRHLTRIERSVYRDMLDMYYDTEAPLPLDDKALRRKLLARSDEESTAVEQVLNEFFTKTAQGWHHSRCEREIRDYHANISAKSAAGKASAAKRESERLARIEELNSGSTAVQQPLNSVGSSVQLTNNQEPITNNQEESTASSSGDDVRQCPTGSLVDLYHELMPLNPQVKIVNAARKGAIKARWQEASKLTCKPFGYTTKAAGLEAWRRFFAICADSPFLTGLSPPSPGKPPFIADIDFIFSASAFAKILENKYHRDAP